MLFALFIKSIYWLIFLYCLNHNIFSITLIYKIWLMILFFFHMLLNQRFNFSIYNNLSLKCKFRGSNISFYLMYFILLLIYQWQIDIFFILANSLHLFYFFILLAIKQINFLFLNTFILIFYVHFINSFVRILTFIQVFLNCMNIH